MSSSSESTKKRFHEIETSQFAYRRNRRTVSALKRCQPVAGGPPGGAAGEGSAGEGEGGHVGRLLVRFTAPL